MSPFGAATVGPFVTFFAFVVFILYQANAKATPMTTAAPITPPTIPPTGVDEEGGNAVAGGVDVTEDDF
jgi:hypothetical protein